MYNKACESVRDDGFDVWLRCIGENMENIVAGKVTPVADLSCYMMVVENLVIVVPICGITSNRKYWISSLDKFDQKI